MAALVRSSANNRQILSPAKVASTEEWTSVMDGDEVASSEHIALNSCDLMPRCSRGRVSF